MFLRSLAWLTLGAALFLACEDRVTGGYDDVENPAIALALKDNQGQPIASGDVRVYARFQNPASDSLPLLTYLTPATGTLTLDDSTLMTAMAEANLRGAIWPDSDTLEFNLVCRNSSHEVFANGFVLTREDNKFHFHQWLNENTLREADRLGRLDVVLNLKPAVLNFQGSVGVHGRELGLKSVFVPGSPYHAPTQEDGTFTLARLASGRYEIKAMSQDGKVYAAENRLNTDSSYTGENWSEADVIWIEQ